MVRKEIYKINGIFFVAESIESAVRMFKKKYSFPIEIEEIVLVRDDTGCSSAYVEGDEDAAVEEAPKDVAQDPAYLESLTLSNEPVPTDAEIEIPPVWTGSFVDLG